MAGLVREAGLRCAEGGGVSVRFKPRLRDTVAANVASLRAMGGGAELPPDLQRSLDAMPLPKRRNVQTALDIDAVHANRPPRATKKIERYLEKDVLRAITQLLAVHRNVLFAVRQNTGSASYEQASGKWAPVNFYSWIKTPGEQVTLPDVWGMTIHGRSFFIEVKRPDWKAPRDDRERRQAAFLDCARRHGCLALFATSAQEVADALR